MLTRVPMDIVHAAFQVVFVFDGMLPVALVPICRRFYLVNLRLGKAGRKRGWWAGARKLAGPTLPLKRPDQRVLAFRIFDLFEISFFGFRISGAAVGWLSWIGRLPS